MNYKKKMILLSLAAIGLTIFVLILPIFKNSKLNISNDDIFSYVKERNDWQKATIERIVDGDTIVVNINYEKYKVRLIGIDTPESVASDEKRNCEEGKIASNYVKTLVIPGETVFLEFDEELYDKYERLLAYVYLSNGEMLQEILLREGYAKLLTVEPNVKYVDTFSSLEDEAKQNEIMFWDGYFVLD